MLSQVTALAVTLAAGSVLWVSLAAQPTPTSPAAGSPASSKPESQAPDALAPVAFLSGRWVEMNAEGSREEHWSSPRGGTMLGMFRWDKADGSPNMLEILAITSEGGDLVLRLHHFSPKLEVRGDGAKPMTLKLTAKGERMATFTPTANAEMLTKVVYQCPTPDRLKISVVLAAEPGAQAESLEFDLKREVLK